jgi:anti-sigma B factor antagonist
MAHVFGDGQAGSHLALVLSGDIDLSRADEVQGLVDAFSHSEHLNAGVDLSGVEFMDSTGAAGFMAMSRIAAGRGGVVTLTGVGRQPRRVLEILGVGDLFGVGGQG